MNRCKWPGRFARRPLTALTLLLGLNGMLAGAPQSASGWPCWRGPNHDNISTEKGVFGAGASLTTAWKKTFGTGYSGISVVGSRLVTMDSDGARDYVVCLDARSGEELWRYAISETYPGRDGAADGPTSTPAIDGGKVFALGPWGHLLALELQTGRLVWSTHLADDLHSDRPKWGFTTSPLVLGDLLVVVTGGEQASALTAFDKSSGKPRWSSGSGPTDYQSAIPATLAGRRQIVYAGNESIRGLDPATGKELWGFDHGGQFFYRRIINPLAIAPDRLFLKHTRMESMLLRISKDESGFQAEKLWDTPHIKLNYNIPVYNQGRIYGHSGRFLTCINAVDGQLAWKSRPPGDGFLILVDGHLIVLTKQGSVHVAKASPQRYEEVAALQLFDKEVWTPPSFANGRVFGRSYFGQIAAADVVPSVELAGESATPTRPKRLTVPGSRFAEFVDKVEAAPAAEREAMIDKFMAAQKRFPVIECDRMAHIIYRGQARDLVLLADMFEAGEQVPIEHIQGTDFYYASFELEPDARLGYRFLKDFEETLADPLNPRKTASVFGGERSEIVMPESADPAHLAVPAGGPRGRMESFDLTSRFWSYGSRKVQVYLPAGYDEGNRRYPVLYVHHGSLALRGGLMTNTLDNLIGKAVRPIIAVFVDRQTPYEYARSELGQHIRMMVEELIPRIDRDYRTLADPQSRAVMGGLEAGYGAIYTAFKRPDIFGMAAAQSARDVGAGAEQLFALISQKGKPDLRLYLDWGRRDYRNATMAYDVPGFNRKLFKALRDRGCRVSGGEVNAGTDFLSWRLRTDQILETFFPLQ